VAAVLTVVRRMSISRSEFFRTLPDALGIDALAAAGDTVTVETPTSRLEIRFREVAPLRLASLTLPAADIELRFAGYRDTEVAAVLDRFDLYFRRGGG
jgi:hypothetical protein